MVLLLGVLVEMQVLEQFIECIGLLVELVMLCEGLVYVGVEFIEDKSCFLGIVLRGSDDLLLFVLEWLDVIVLGVDLGEVVFCFMYSFFVSVLVIDFVMVVYLFDIVWVFVECIFDLW